jgi:DNA repair exonuclease SbcCD ATPase subunit
MNDSERSVSTPQTDDYKEMIREQFKGMKESMKSMKESLAFQYGSTQTLLHKIEKHVEELDKSMRDMQLNESRRYNECPNTKGLTDLEKDFNRQFGPISVIIKHPNYFIAGLAVAVLGIYGLAWDLFLKSSNTRDTIEINTEQINRTRAKILEEDAAPWLKEKKHPQ